MTPKASGRLMAFAGWSAVRTDRRMSQIASVGVLGKGWFRHAVDAELQECQMQTLPFVLFGIAGKNREKKCVAGCCAPGFSNLVWSSVAK